MPDTNPPIVIAKRYYPRLSEIVTVEDLPEFLSFVQEGLNAIFDKIHYKNLQYSKSPRGDSAFYSLDIVSRKPIGFTLPGGLKLVLNPDATDANISSFPIVLEYQWEILGFLRSFSLDNFSFTPKDFYSLGLQVFRISDDQVLANTLNFFTTPATGSINKFDQLAVDINTAFPGANFTLPQDPTVDEIVAAIDANEFLSEAAEVIFTTYILNADIGVLEDNLQRFFNIMVPEGIKAYIQKLIKPKARAAFTLSAGLQFPREYLQPVYGPNGENPYGESNPSHALDVIPADNTGNPIVTLRFGEAIFYADTEQGLGYSMEFVVETSSYAQIGNTGLIIFLDNLKIDLSKDSNIAEADADGRPADFVGVYAEQLDVILPKKWFKQENGQTLKISAKKLLVGTGGFSGNLALETVNNTPATSDDYFWFTLGDSFRLGFNRFDITFKQSKVISSGIQGALEIQKFTYPDDSPLSEDIFKLQIEGHIDDDGGFNLTATTQPLPIVLKDVFAYNLKTVELGRESDDSPFYIGTSGTLQFEGFLKEFLKLGPIEIQSLRIYSDGSMEFSGGSINLLEPIVLKLGPVDITVTAIHYGSHQKEVNGVMRKFNFFGFDGGLSVDPLGVEIRGDGIKFYYCTDNDSFDNYLEPYVHIQTIYVDLTLPASTPVAIVNGWLNIPEPGVSQEYAGGLKLQLPKAKITGSVDMKLSPRYPAFILDASLEFPAPIPLGSFAIYGFRGLLGYRYVAEKEAVGLVSGVNTWYDYYKVPPRGIHVKKFRQPIDTAGHSDPFSIGAGASLGTSFDNGTVLNLKVMLLLSVPSVFMLDGRASVLSARLGLESTKEPPFFLMAAIGDNSLEMAFGADFMMPTKDGSILKLYAEMQAAYFFNDSSKWYVNFGTKEKPTTATILSLVDLKSYLMLSAKGIEAGARGEFDFKRTYANIIKVHAWAYIEVGGKISFERPQFGAYLDAGIGADIDVKFVSLTAAFDILFAVEASEPFLVYGRVRIKIKIRILWVFKFSFNAEVEVLWEKSKYVNRSPVTPLIQEAVLTANPNALEDVVKGVNMLSNEVFDLAYLGMGTINDNTPPASIVGWEDYIIPLDTYIDIKTQKGLLPEAISNIIGGISNPPQRYTDLVPPDKNVRGKELRQVKHQYSITKLNLSFWNPNVGVNGQWQPYHPYKALYPNDNTPEYNNLKIGQFQKTDGQYNTIRLLATTPFSYTEQGQPGWYIPEQYGMTASSFFCEGEALIKICANFLEKPLAQRYYCFDNNQMFYSREAAFLLTDKEDDEYAEITDHPNVFGFDQSLAFDIHNKLQILLPEPSVSVRLKLTSDSQAVRVRYFCSLIDDDSLEVRYGNPNPVAFTRRSTSYDVLVNVRNLDQPIEYHKPQWRAITKIIIEPVYAVRSLLLSNLDSWQLTLNHNLQIQLGSLSGQYQSPIPFMTKYDYLNNLKGTVQLRTYIFDPANNRYMDKDKQVWLQSWDTHNDSKVDNNPIGFSLSGNKVTVEGKYQLVDVDFNADKAIPDVDNQGMRAIAEVPDIGDYQDTDGYIELQVSDYVNCVKHLRLCRLRHLLKASAVNFVHPDIVTSADFPRIQKAMLRFKNETVAFDQQYPDYRLVTNAESEIRDIDAFIAVPDIKAYPKAYQAAAIAITQIAVEGDCECDDCVKDNVLCELYTLLANMLINCIRDPRQKIAFDLSSIIGCVNEFRSALLAFNLDNPSYGLTSAFQDQIAIIDAFLDNPTMQNYIQAYAAIKEIVSVIAEKGNCKCGVNTDALEDLYDTIKDIFNDHFQDLDNIKDFTDQIRYTEFILDLIQQFHNQYPGLNLPDNLADYIRELEAFLNDPNAGTLADAVAAIIKILEYLNELGLGTFAKLPKKTLLHEVCWLSLESYEYNLNIPSQAAITADLQATVAGIERYIQPIWKPATQYKLQFTLKDNVDNGSANSNEYSYSYGFATAGPVGHFHTDPNTDYGSINPDAWPLTSLKRYIDYERSYPYADGNLLSAKPLFYNDDAITQIFLYYTKSYVTHFFQDWQAYPNASDDESERSGRIKIIIKDPAEGLSIVNPPYLDYDENDVTTIHIPQTVESWHTDEHPQLPFVINQFSNLYNTPGNCVSSGGDPIKPASEYTTIEMKHLKPLKLYTAIVNNLYDASGHDDYAALSKTKEVHRFVFQTSRYANFGEQINSYILKSGSGDEYVERQAIFNLDQAFMPQQINDAYNVVSNPDTTDALSTRYQHAFDRVIEGVLKLNPLDAAISTEFNIIRNTADNNKVVAIIIRNPEPFNIPRIPLAEIADTIQVMDGSTANATYKILHSKDYSQAIIMHDSRVISDTSLSIRFCFKKWDGYAFTAFGDYPPITIEL